MKARLKTILALSALGLMIAAGGVPNAEAQSDVTSVPEPAPKKIPGAKPKAKVLSGQVNDDGTILVSDLDLKSWKITNPEAVKSHKNEHVRVNVVQDPATGSMTIESVTKVKEKISAQPQS